MGCTGISSGRCTCPPLLPAQGTGPGTTSGHVVEETFEQQRPHSSEKKNPDARQAGRQRMNKFAHNYSYSATHPAAFPSLRFYRLMTGILLRAGHIALQPGPYTGEDWVHSSEEVGDALEAVGGNCTLKVLSMLKNWILHVFLLPIT